MSYSTGALCTIGLLILIMSLCVIGTCVDILQRKQSSNSEADSCEEAQTESEEMLKKKEHLPLQEKLVKEVIAMKNDEEAIAESIDTCTLTSKVCRSTTRSPCMKFLLCFSVIANTQTIFSTHMAKGAIKSINGIRGKKTNCFIVLC